MPQKAHPDLLLAQTLAAPFTPRSQGTPLSMRLLPEGGMVIIAADGRKLWFSADEVNAAREKLTQPVKPVKSSLPPVKLSMHMWDADPSKRFVILDGQRMGEGDRNGALQVVAILRNGVIIERAGIRARVPLP